MKYLLWRQIFKGIKGPYKCDCFQAPSVGTAALSNQNKQYTPESKDCVDGCQTPYTDRNIHNQSCGFGWSLLWIRFFFKLRL